MQHLTHVPEIAEQVAMNLIFDACRSNLRREPRTLRDGYTVTFNLKANGEHEAVLRDASSEVVALADIDGFDC